MRRGMTAESRLEVEHREHIPSCPRDIPRTRARTTRLFAEDLFDESPKKTPPSSPAPEMEAVNTRSMTEEVYRRAATFMGRPLHIESFGKTHVFWARFADHQAPAIVLRETLGHYEAAHRAPHPREVERPTLPYVGLASFTAALLDATRKETDPRADMPRIRAWMNQLG